MSGPPRNLLLVAPLEDKPLFSQQNVPFEDSPRILSKIEKIYSDCLQDGRYDYKSAHINCEFLIYVVMAMALPASLECQTHNPCPLRCCPFLY